MSLIQVLKFRTWETRLFKMPRFEKPCFQTGTRVTTASRHKGYFFISVSSYPNNPVKLKQDPA